MLRCRPRGWPQLRRTRSQRGGEAAGGEADLEAARATFRKKLKKLDVVTVADGEARLRKATSK